MSTEEITPPAPITLPRPTTAAYERAGEQVGRAYATAVTAVTGPIRRAPAPTWHWKAAHRTGSALRRTAGRGADHLERRARTAPRRLLSGLRRLLKSGIGKSVKAAGTRLGTTGFLTWWGATWAMDSGLTLDPALLAPPAAGLLLLTCYALGKEPDKPPMTRRDLARRHQAARELLWAIDQMLRQAPGLHLAELADQITARSTALGTPIKATVASLRALLTPLGVPIRDQLALDGRTRPGIAASDWRIWITRHTPTRPWPEEPTPPPSVGEQQPPREEPPAAPTREEPLPHAETPTEAAPLDPAKPQVSDGRLDISDRDLGQDTPPSGEGQPRTYSPAERRLLAHIRTAAGDARGAHLRDVVAVAKAAGDTPTVTVTELRRALEALDIPVQDKLWIRGGNTRGVLLRDVPALPDTPAEPAQETD